VTARTLGALGAALAATVLLAACEPPPVDTVQRGYRGTAMVEVYHPATVAAAAAINAPPAELPPASPDGPKASQVLQNVKVLGDLSIGQFTQMMVDMTAWVAPQQGCTYCHNAANFADDSLYTKVVARRMLQMTQHINADWKTHVAATGVTCYTCHRGNNVPANIWFKSGEPADAPGMLGNRAGQNAPATQVGLASLPNDPFSAYLGSNPAEIRVVATSALPSDGHPSLIMRTEATYGLMIHMSTALGVNCTYCHNSRSFGSWQTSTPQRVTAYYGIRMARDLNVQYLESLAGVFPPNRLGPTGDVPKLNCATCHQGAYKPLYGADILHGYPGLTAVSMVTGGGDDASVVVENGVVKFYFATGKADIAAGAAGPLAEISRQVAGGGSAVVSGFNDPTGDAAKNEELAKQRAFAVRDALKGAGIAEDRIQLKKPESTTGTGSNAEARRVEVAVVR
jgi:photosynthetic reaction center cytochrome c subunit